VRLQKVARILAQMDALAALAEAAALFNYVKPMIDKDDVIEIREGRHPMVERFLREGESFVPNDVRLEGDTQRVIILTGPNMSGKSVFVRQVALIVLMAQMGSFVPASFARIGVIDRIFTRAGASDDIMQGRSTFLVEMSEASYILRHATPRSLIVLDEVGRGTSTYDGISLAWAIAEEIHNVVGAKTLFATHYHELTALEEVLGEAIKNYTMAIRERGNEVVFLRQVVAGSAEKSFGIHVARMAGLPTRVIGRAEEVLQGLEVSRETSDGGLTTADRRPPTADGDYDEHGLTTGEHALVKEERTLYDARIEIWRSIFQQLMDLDIANMTPLQALNLLNEIQLELKESSDRVVS
jgi:DNA mismatch repair protein MutS